MRGDAMRPFVLGFSLAASLGTAAAFGQPDTAAQAPAKQPAPARKGESAGGFGGGFGVQDTRPSGHWNPPNRELSREEVFLPETPEYVAERSERLDEAWRSLNAAVNRPVALDVARIPLRSA